MIERQLLIRVYEIDEKGNQEEIARGTIGEKGSKFRELREGGETYLSPSVYFEERSKFTWHVLVKALQSSRVGRCLKDNWRWKDPRRVRREGTESAVAATHDAVAN